MLVGPCPPEAARGEWVSFFPISVFTSTLCSVLQCPSMHGDIFSIRILLLVPVFAFSVIVSTALAAPLL